MIAGAGSLKGSFSEPKTTILTHWRAGCPHLVEGTEAVQEGLSCRKPRAFQPRIFCPTELRCQHCEKRLHRAAVAICTNERRRPFSAKAHGRHRSWSSAKSPA